MKINPLTAENPYYYLTTMINTNVFSGAKSSDDKNLLKLSFYFIDHFNYLKSKEYKDFETNNLFFSVSRIPVNYISFFKKHENASRESMVKLLQENNEIRQKLADNLRKNKAHLFSRFGYNCFNYFEKKNKEKAFNFLLDFYVVLPSENDLHYRDSDNSKFWLYRFAIWLRREFHPTFYNSIGIVRKLFILE
jgi:hypothetical protein